MASTKISFGFLMYELQLIDMAGPMDILNNASKEFVSAYASVFNPEHKDELIAKSLDIEFYYIAETKEPVRLTGNFFNAPSNTFADCPKLDYLLVGGGSPYNAIEPGKTSEAMKQFIREQSKECKVVFSTCTGALFLAAAGVLDEQKATVNHAFVNLGQDAFPKVKWSKDKNWVVNEDEKFWTSSGAVAGMDMVTEWVKQQTSSGVVDLMTQSLDYQPRDIDGKPMSYVNGRGERVGA